LNDELRWTRCGERERHKERGRERKGKTERERVCCGCGAEIQHSTSTSATAEFLQLSRKGCQRMLLTGWRGMKEREIGGGVLGRFLGTVHDKDEYA